MKILSKSILVTFLLFMGIVATSFAQDHKPLLQHRQGFVKIADGSLYYDEIGRGIPIIIVHGGPGVLDQGYLQPQLFQLAAEHRLIFYDQRGSGKSLNTIFDEKHINMDQFVKDLEVLRTSLGLEKFILMGHSWGGLLAMQYAIAHQDHLLGLVLLNTAPADDKGQKAFLDEFAERTKNIHDDIKPLFSYEDFKALNSTQISALHRKLASVYFYDPNKVTDLNLNFNVASAQSGFRVMEEMLKTSWLRPNIDLFPQLKTLNVPTFILHGKQDIVPVWTAEEIKATIPHAEIVIIDRCDHYPFVEQPSQFFTELNNFLNKISP